MGAVVGGDYRATTTRMGGPVRVTVATALSMRRERRSISAAVRSIVAIGVRSLQPAR